MAIDCNDILRGYVQNLQSLCISLKDALAAFSLDSVSMSIDVLEQTGFEYHSAFGFTLFSADTHGELGRGGCYDVRFGDDHNKDLEMAKGFTLYMDTITQSMPLPQSELRVFVAYDVDWDNVRALQEQGWVVVRGAKGQAEILECSHVYDGVSVREI